MGRPRTRPLLSARRYISAALSVTTSGRFRRPESPLSWIISSALMFRLDAWAREMIVERFLSKAENLPGGPDWLSRRPSSVRLGTGAAYCSVGSDRTKPQLVHMT